MTMTRRMLAPNYSSARLTLLLAIQLGAAGCSGDNLLQPQNTSHEHASTPDAGGTDTGAVADDALQMALQDLAASELEERNILGLGISVRLKDGRLLEASAGRVGPTEADTAYSAGSTRQVIGSTTKLFTAVLVMQLVESRELSLDDTLERWFDFPSAHLLTVRMLLNHTSGLSDCLQVIPSGELAHPWTPQALFDAALEAGPLAAPGGNVAWYSNTNFLLLALIAERLTGTSWEQSIQTQIASPLGLAQTRYEAQPQSLADGWFLDDGEWTSSLQFLDASTGWGFGALVSTNRELARFTQALFHGELFEDASTLEQMLAFGAAVAPETLSPGEPPQDVGLGIIRYRADDVTLHGHLGHVLGYDTGTFLDPNSGAQITITANTDHAVTGITALKIAQALSGG